MRNLILIFLQSIYFNFIVVKTVLLQIPSGERGSRIGILILHRAKLNARSTRLLKFLKRILGWSDKRPPIFGTVRLGVGATSVECCLHGGMGFRSFKHEITTRIIIGLATIIICLFNETTGGSVATTGLTCTSLEFISDFRMRLVLQEIQMFRVRFGFVLNY